MAQNSRYLKGLNTLRFFAAFFVILAHGHRSLEIIGVLPDSRLKVFDRGGTAVVLFFTLSGFLITYLLLVELANTQTIRIGSFYFRRMIRIWPLYFLCLAAGTVVLKIIVPRVVHDSDIHYRLWPFLLFLPNLAAYYDKVGLLFPLWTIGVEEQFYLLWAPLMLLFARRPLILIAGGAALTCAWYCGLELMVRPHLAGKLGDFLATFRFHNMLIGAVFAWILARKLDWYQQSIFARPIVQMLLLGVILYHFLIGIYPVPEVFVTIMMSMVYGCVFINVSSIDSPVTDLEIQPFKYLGQISFGLYIYHMFVDYVLRLAFMHLKFKINPAVEAVIYLSLLLLIAVGVAAVSYHTFEAYFLSFRKRQRTGIRRQESKRRLADS